MSKIELKIILKNKVVYKRWFFLRNLKDSKYFFPLLKINFTIVYYYKFYVVYYY